MVKTVFSQIQDESPPLNNIGKIKPHLRFKCWLGEGSGPCRGGGGPGHERVVGKGKAEGRPTSMAWGGNWTACSLPPTQCLPPPACPQSPLLTFCSCPSPSSHNPDRPWTAAALCLQSKKSRAAESKQRECAGRGKVGTEVGGRWQGRAGDEGRKGERGWPRHGGGVSGAGGRGSREHWVYSRYRYIEASTKDGHRHRYRGAEDMWQGAGSSRGGTDMESWGPGTGTEGQGRVWPLSPPSCFPHQSCGWDKFKITF